MSRIPAANIQPAAAMPRRANDPKHRIDRTVEVGDWDFADEIFPPGALDPMPPPRGLQWAHRLETSDVEPSPELRLIFGVEHYYREHHKTRVAAIRRKSKRQYERRKLLLAAGYDPS
jgi:hypothetical protein